MITDFMQDPSGVRSAEFWSWLRANPGGYFVNVTGGDRGRLHRTDCPHMRFESPESINFLSRRKLCGASRGELESRAIAEGISIAPCPDCDTGERR